MSSGAAVAFALGAPRSGMAYWWQTFLAMLRWEVGSLRLRLPAPCLWRGVNRNDLPRLTRSGRVWESGSTVWSSIVDLPLAA